MSIVLALTEVVDPWPAAAKESIREDMEWTKTRAKAARS